MLKKKGKDLYLESEIEELNLKVKPFNWLKRNGVNYIKDLVNLEKSDFMNFNNFDEAVYKKVIKNLKKNRSRLPKEIIFKFF